MMLELNLSFLIKIIKSVYKSSGYKLYKKLVNIRIQVFFLKMLSPKVNLYEMRVKFWFLQ